MPDREPSSAQLRRAYPYVWAWGTELGSYDYYKHDESAVAAADGVPDDVLHRDEWNQINSHGRQERALTQEQAGVAVILRDEQGQPYRVWWRVAVIADADRRQRVERYADNLRKGRNVHA
jgi:hypothetical protein